MALSGPEAGFVLVLVVVVALPLAAIAFGAGARNSLQRFGDDEFSISHDSAPDEGLSGGGGGESDQVREDEIRQMVEARSYRAVARGAEALDVDAEVDRLLAHEREGAEDADLSADKGLRDEVRQLVIARNERRVRQGKEPLDVEAEIEREIRELENLGQ